jgi:CheY-like chemotaxis protein
MATESCPRCVLLIEDDEPLREAIGAFLEARGYVTVPAEDAQRAVDLLLQTDLPRPCLILADLMTLSVDWGSLMGALQLEDQLATLPMALVSVRTPARPSKRVKKPLDLELLARIVREHCCGGDRDGGKASGGRGAIHGSGPR